MLISIKLLGWLDVILLFLKELLKFFYEFKVLFKVGESLDLVKGAINQLLDGFVHFVVEGLRLRYKHVINRSEGVEFVSVFIKGSDFLLAALLLILNRLIWHLTIVKYFQGL